MTDQTPAAVCGNCDGIDPASCLICGTTRATAPLDLDAIQARANHATDGPWWNDEHEVYAGPVGDYTRCLGETCDPDHGGGGANNAEFIAHARQDVPALLAEIRRLRAENAELAADLDGRDEEARERWINKQLEQTSIRSVEFRNGAHMDFEPARELVAHWVAAARTMLGDAPNYSETKLEFDVKVAESPELYTLVVQRHATGALTPHEARQRAEDRLAAVLALLPQDPAEDINASCVPLRHIRAAVTGQTRPDA